MQPSFIQLILLFIFTKTASASSFNDEFLMNLLNFLLHLCCHEKEAATAAAKEQHTTQE